MYALHSQLDSKLLPHRLAVIEEQQRRRRKRQAQKRKHADPPPETGRLEQLRGSERQYTADDAPEDRAGRNGGSGVLLERVDVVVLAGVEDGDLAESEEDG